MKRRHVEFPPFAGTILGSDTRIEWEPLPVPAWVVAKMKIRAAKLGAIIAADWLKDALALAPIIHADRLWLEAEARREWLEKDAADSELIARRMVALMVPALEKAIATETKSLRREIKKARHKLESMSKKVARQKLAAFKRRR